MNEGARDALNNAEHKIGQDPCEIRGRRCRHYDECANEHVACGAFRFYVNSSATRSPRRGNPTKEIYMEVFLSRDIDEPPLDK